MSEPVGMGAAPTPKSPMQQLSDDPLLGPIISQLRGNKLYLALKARLEAEPNATRRRLLEEVLGNRRWFLEALSRAPSMRTVNGIGTALYGSSDKDPSDGTYVATLCFVVFFIPVFPMGQYLVRPAGGRKWSFFGKVPISATVKRWRQLMGLAFAAAALSVAWGIVEHAGHSDVQFVNALDIPVQIHAGKLDLRVGANARKTERMAQGHYDIKVTTEKGRLLEEEKVVIPGATDVVAYNVAGAAPLYHVPVTYYAAGHEGKDTDEPIFDAGKRFFKEDHIDFVFTDPPKEISMGESEHKATRWHFAEAPGGWKTSVGYLLSKKQNDAAVKIAEAVANAAPDDEATLETAANLISEARGEAERDAFAQRLVERFPDAIEPQRMYQTLMMMSGKRDEVRVKYRERADKNPDSATAGYLAARLDLPAEALPRYQALAAKFPDDVYIRRGLSWVLLQLRRFPESVVEFDALAKLPHTTNDDELEGMAQALVGAGKLGEATARVAKVAARSPRGPMLYARLATLLGKDAPYPPDHFFEPKSAGRAWYEAWLGEPGAFDKLPPLEGPLQNADAIVSASRRSGAEGLTVLEAVPVESLGYLDRPLGLLLAGQALKHGGAKQAGHILESLSPPASEVERAAVLSGKDSPEITDMTLDIQSALELARAWRLSGAEARKLIEQAKSDDLLHRGVNLALRWK